MDRDDDNDRPQIPVTEDELHAYVDNELPAERRGDVEAWLAAHPDDAERVQSWRAMAEALHARYDAVANEPVPKRLELERLVRPPRKWVYGAIAASLLAFVAGGGTGWLAHGAARLADHLPEPSPTTRSMRTASMSSRSAIPSRCRATSARICRHG